MIELDREQRAEILKAVSSTVQKRFYDSSLRGLDWDATVERHRGDIVNAPTMEAFELEVTKLLGELKTSHIGFFHRKLERTSSKMAISANYVEFPVGGLDRWVFQDVHEGGPAFQAGIRPGDVLVSIDGRQFVPPEHPIFTMGQRVKVIVLSSGLQRRDLQIDIPLLGPKKSELPYARPKLVMQRRLNHDIGYIRVAMFPGILGMEVARDITSAVEALKGVDRLILDVRGNTGGGLGVVRAMGLLTPDRIPVGGHVSREQLRGGQDGAYVGVFDRIPANKLGVVPLAVNLLVVPFVWKKIGRQSTVRLMTEGLGNKSFHNRTVLLVDRHTASASEMLVAFAKENRLATVVGEATPGRLLSGSKFKLPYEYWLALPVGAYRTAGGKILEGIPTEPDICVPFDPEKARAGIDTQLDVAVEVASQLH